MNKGLVALSPIAVFLAVYVVTSIVAGDFYKMPISVAFLITSVYAICVTRHLPLHDRITLFSEGAGHPNMMQMIWIFILAGAFAASAKGMGAIDATVNLTLRLLPDGLLLAGLFAAACFISLSIGTSVGTVVALTPIAAGIADATGTTTAFLTAIVVGGAFFGDNLSFISDTTIMATRTQGCRMSDKFKVNSMIVVPAAAIVLVAYVALGTQIHSPQTLPVVDALKVLPYVVVLVCAIAGIDVMVVLLVGIILSGIIGIAYGNYDIFGWFGALGDGILGMGELMIVTMLAGGVMQLIRHGGGIEYVVQHLTRRIHGKRGAELAIGSLVAFTNVCTANNTVAILTVGPIAREVATRYGIDPRKSASLLDTFSCLAQSVIPYGAQLLMAASLAAINPIEIIPYLYYPFTMGACALLCILLRYPRRYS
ncbi:MAG: Na+/H+ antiporter NhaC family protein [Bacteroidaceae bacterium]|nr:Na+/H+ antiporter NhaC family protein [Bacteroidaceae bacterium]